MVPFINERRDATNIKEVVCIAILSVPMFLLARNLVDTYIYSRYLTGNYGIIAQTIDPIGYFAVFGIIYFLYSSYVWRLFSRLKLFDLPIIDGVWEGTITAEQLTQPIPMTMNIRQTLNKVDMESTSSGNFTSNAVLMAYDHDSAGKSRIKYLYRCMKDGKNDHYGTAVLTFLNQGRAEGWYYTDANSKQGAGYSSKGTILLTRK